MTTIRSACLGGASVGAAAAALAALLISGERPALAHATGGANAMTFSNQSGSLRTILTKGRFDLSNPFFRSLLELVRSKDGTTIAYERSGNGPALILVDGAGERGGAAHDVQCDLTSMRFMPDRLSC